MQTLYILIIVAVVAGLVYWVWKRGREASGAADLDWEPTPVVTPPAPIVTPPTPVPDWEPAGGVVVSAPVAEAKKLAAVAVPKKPRVPRAKKTDRPMR